uniref:DUF2442 domain-containing protein n=1 Tax=Candidatus Kentrum sp. UNK TaxID=2126344 RepID=A0A451ARU1_9GAMM|nr:MAG: Protein of unknown function (DUF2442) [Candidatus Kentron sp. UNK]VFK68769.1 MAG: Protein of unknown function (DUF2442) [Candidatus Kentron sp. UNK]
MLGIKKVSHHRDYLLYVELTNGIEGYFDVSPYLDKGIFVQLKNVEYLKMVKPDACGIRWPKGHDFSADTIEYELRKSPAKLRREPINRGSRR